MSEIKLFEQTQVRSHWDDEAEKWYFSVIDVVAILTESANPRRYWSDLKRKIQAEKGNIEVYEEIVQLKMKSPDGKMRQTDASDVAGILRIIQSIPSPKAEPFKLWLAQVGSERLDQMNDPELSINQAMADYARLGYSESWINQRLKSIEVRKELTDEWQRTGVQEGVQFAILTDIITKAWSDKTTKEYKKFKGLKKENLRDNMTSTELILNMLAEASTKDISNATNPQNFDEQKQVAKQGGNVAKVARQELESKTGKSVVSNVSAKQFLIEQAEKTNKDEQDDK